MSKVAQFAQFSAKPGMGSQVVDALEDALKAARQEAGTQVYVIHQSVSDPDTVWMYELYESPEAQQDHSGSQATARLRAAVGDLLREPLSVQKGTVHGGFGLP